MIVKVLAASAALAFSVACAEAKPFAEMFPGRSYPNPKAQEIVDAIDYRDGAIELGSGGVRLNVPGGFYFIGADDARRVIVEAWGNPPSVATGVLGMIFPSSMSPVDDTWGAVITYDEDGYVSDEDAAKIDYATLLREMQESTAKGSEERVKQGFPSIRLVGWASPPFYDPATHKLHWAKELEFNGKGLHTLNYDVRALGRRGVLNMNFVASMDQLGEIKGVIPAVMEMPEFVAGSRYADYVPGVDKVAAYGIGGLIAGKVLSKIGLLALALAFLKKGWVLLIVAGGWAWRRIARLFSREPNA